MCGRLFLTDPRRFVNDRAQIARPFEIAEFPEEVMRPRYNVAPQQPILVLAGERGQEKPEFKAVRWGLVPSWARDESVGARLINARGETVLEKPSFRDLMRTRRCLVPASGFYEWQKLPSDSKSGSKRPHAVRLADDADFAFAGLWDRWRDVETAAVVTCEPNDLLRRLHHRMAVIVPRERWADWLDVDRVPAEEAAGLLRPLPSEAMRAYPVSRRVGSVGNDDPSLIEEVGEVDGDGEEQGMLF